MAKLDSTFRKAEESPGFLLWKAANVLQRLHWGCLKGLDLTPAQFSVMTCLVYLHQDGPVTPSRVVSHTGMDKMMVSDLVKTLLAKRLIRKKPNREDGRSFLIEPTALGVRKTNSAVREVEAVDDEFFRRARSLEALREALLALVGAESGGRSV